MSRKGSKQICWTQSEDDILCSFYPQNGSAYCKKMLNRTRKSITNRSSYLGLKLQVAKRTLLPQKYVIRKLSDNKVLSLCKIHGESVHSFRSNKIEHCFKCVNIKNSKNNKIPVNNFAQRLRRSMNYGLKRIDSKNDVYRPRGCFKLLPYSPLQLCNYINDIKKQQSNKCPICGVSYEKCKMNIEHIVPLERAKTEEEVIKLFNLDNLSLMCNICNSQKNDKDYIVWMGEKNVRS